MVSTPDLLLSYDKDFNFAIFLRFPKSVLFYEKGGLAPSSTCYRQERGGYSLSGLYLLTNPARLNLPGTKVPAGIALKVTESRKLHHHVKVITHGHHVKVISHGHHVKVIIHGHHVKVITPSKGKGNDDDFFYLGMIKFTPHPFVTMEATTMKLRGCIFLFFQL